MLGALAIIAILIAGVVGQWKLRKCQTELEWLRKEFDSYQRETGKLVILNKFKYHVRGFYDPYVSKDGYMFRFYFPKETDCTFYFADGLIPESGFPEQRMALERFGDSYTRGMYVLAIDPHRNRDGVTDVTIKLFSEDRYGQGDRGDLAIVGKLQWQSKRSVNVAPPGSLLDSETRTFDLERPFVVTKRFEKNNEGDQFGCMIWIEKNSNVEPREPIF